MIRDESLWWARAANTGTLQLKLKLDYLGILLAKWALYALKLNILE